MRASPRGATVNSKCSTLIPIFRTWLKSWIPPSPRALRCSTGWCASSATCRVSRRRRGPRPGAQQRAPHAADAGRLRLGGAGCARPAPTGRACACSSSARCVEAAVDVARLARPHLARAGAGHRRDDPPRACSTARRSSTSTSSTARCRWPRTRASAGARPPTASPPARRCSPRRGSTPTRALARAARPAGRAHRRTRSPRSTPWWPSCERTRVRGYAENREEWRLGVCGLGAPVFDARGVPVAAVGMSVPSIRFTRVQAQGLRRAPARLCERREHDPRLQARCFPTASHSASQPAAPSLHAAPSSHRTTRRLS